MKRIAHSKQKSSSKASLKEKKVSQDTGTPKRKAPKRVKSKRGPRETPKRAKPKRGPRETPKRAKPKRGPRETAKRKTDARIKDLKKRLEKVEARAKRDRAAIRHERQRSKAALRNERQKKRAQLQAQRERAERAHAALRNERQKKRDLRVRQKEKEGLKLKQAELKLARQKEKAELKLKQAKLKLARQKEKAELKLARQKEKAELKLKQIEENYENLGRKDRRIHRSRKWKQERLMRKMARAQIAGFGIDEVASLMARDLGVSVRSIYLMYYGYWTL